MKNYDNIDTIPCITNDQVDRLYRFTREHFVEYYDLQTELVDHLAKGIEKQWEANPSVLFEDALQIEFKKFGVYGFSDIVEKRTRTLEKRYHKFVWHHFKDFFTLPKILFTISLIIVVALLLPKLQTYYIETILGIATFMLLFTLIYTIINKKKVKKEKDNKRWMMEDIIANMGGAAAFFYIPFQVIFHSFNFLNLSYAWVNLLVATFLVSWFLYSYIMFAIIPKKAESYLQEIYPEYKYVT